MSKPQRTFIHELAEVYKLYSESQDKEPLRSVFICITELTSSPTLTIMEVIQKQDDAERKRQQLEELKSAQIEQSLFNAIIISDVFFGVKREDLEASISDILKSYPEVTSWQLQWIKESTFVFHHQDYQAMDKEKEDRLYILSKTFKKIFRDKLLAFDCKMCLVTEGADYILKTDSTNVTVTQQIEQVPAPSHNAFEVLQQKVES
ncbi:FKBP12-associated protein [Clavispora lusitaniae]|nr:FKBP12-associated protein [Clavispora lusitaniae]